MASSIYYSTTHNMYGYTHNSFPPHFSDLPPSHTPANYLTPLPIPPFDFDCTTTHAVAAGGYDSPGYTSISSVTKGFSARDLQGASTMQQHYRSESPFLNENDIIIESMNKTCRYSPKEKRERIERYRSKKSQRNFNKKVKYVCRKTLADSRPRIQGRFARNDEIERTNNQGGGEERFNEENVDNWMFNFYDRFSSNIIS